MKSSHKTPRTAAELMASLEKDPDYQKRVALKRQARQQVIADLELVSRPILADLKKVGITVNSLDELRTSGQKYEEAIPILVSWLTVTKDDKLREALVRTLSVPWAAEKGQRALIELFLSLSETEHRPLKWASGNALSILATGEYLEQLIEIVRDRRHGTARQMIVLGLGNLPGERSNGTLIDLLDDPQVAGHAIMALGKLGAVEAAERIRPFLKHRTAWVREEATKALSFIDASSGRANDRT